MHPNATNLLSKHELDIVLEFVFEVLRTVLKHNTKKIEALLLEDKQ